MEIVKSNSNSAAVFLWLILIYLSRCFASSVNHEKSDDSSLNLTLAKQSQTSCSMSSSSVDKNNDFEVKKQNYVPEGVLIYNIPMKTQFEGDFESKTNNTELYDEVGFFSVRRLVRRTKKYDVMVYNVTTEDSYILKLYRIVKRGGKPNAGAPVLLQHGMWGTCKDWLMLDNAGSLAFSASDSGYDVWLANSRGTDEARDHEFFSKHESKYWDFSFDEMGRFDTKAVIDRVLGEARTESLFYVGHSLGSIIFYTFMHYHGVEYREKIRGMVAIPPSAYLYNTETPLLRLRGLVPLVAPFGVPVNSIFPPFQKQLHRILPLFCSIETLNSDVCLDVFYAIAGVSKRQTDSELIKRIVEHYPNGLSVKTGIHLLQQTSFDGFRMYDYGPAKNFLTYSQLTPPSYNLFGIDVQTFNIFGLQDLIVDRSDAERVVAALGTSKGKTSQLIMAFNHLDLIISNFAAPVINSRILHFFRLLEGNPESGTKCNCSCGKQTCPRPRPMSKPQPNVKPFILPPKTSDFKSVESEKNFSSSPSSFVSTTFSSYFDQFIK